MIGNKLDLVDEKIKKDPEEQQKFNKLKSEIEDFVDEQNLEGIGEFSSHLICAQKYGEVYSLIFEMVKKLA